MWFITLLGALFLSFTLWKALLELLLHGFYGWCPPWWLGLGSIGIVLRHLLLELRRSWRPIHLGDLSWMLGPLCQPTLLLKVACGCIVDTFPLKNPLELWKLSCGHFLEGSCLKEYVGISMWTSLRSEPFWRVFGNCLVDNFGGLSFLVDIRWGFVSYWWTFLIK